MDKQDREKVDKSNMWDLLINFHQHCKEGYSTLPSFIPEKIEFNKVVFCGMGGSAIGGDILKVIVEKNSKIIFSVHRDYDVPSYVDEKTLLFATSYSGNTEETISAYKEGLKRKANIFIISSDGQLEKFAREENLPFLKIPGGMPPRCAFGYLFFSSYRILKELNILPEIEEKFFIEIENYVKSFSREKNKALEIAQKIYNKIPLLYSDNYILPCILRWKTQIAENSKSFSFVNVFPEMNHNEIMSFYFPEWFIKKIVCLFFNYGEEHERVKKRLKIIEKIIKNKNVETIKINAKGSSFLEKMIYLVILGDWVSYYLALMNKIDPTEIEEISYLKELLKRR